MDKYEYNVKLEQIKKLIKKKDYATAARIADTIDWYKVKNNQTIIMIADVYEASGRYDQSKENLKLAYDRSGLGRQIAYKLVKICIKCGELEEAEDFYDDFVSAAPKDISKYILQYELAKAKGDPIDKQISILEQYLEEDMDDKWAFELAKLYHKSGQRDKCIRQCDTVMLWFSDGKYVERAMDLKMIYTPLNKSQQERYEARWREKTGQTGFEAEEIRVKEVDVSNKYNTQNIQAALKESMDELYSEEKKESGKRENIFRPTMPSPEYEETHEQYEYSEEALYEEAEETAAGADDYLYRMNQNPQYDGASFDFAQESEQHIDDLGDTKVFVTTRSKKNLGDTKVFAPIRQAVPERINFEETANETENEAYILEEKTIKNTSGLFYEEEPEENLKEIWGNPEGIVENSEEELIEEEKELPEEELQEEFIEKEQEFLVEELQEEFIEEEEEQELLEEELEEEFPEEEQEFLEEELEEEFIEEEEEQAFPEEELEEELEEDPDVLSDKELEELLEKDILSGETEKEEFEEQQAEEENEEVIQNTEEAFELEALPEEIQKGLEDFIAGDDAEVLEVEPESAEIEEPEISEEVSEIDEAAVSKEPEVNPEEDFEEVFSVEDFFNSADGYYASEKPTENKKESEINSEESVFQEEPEKPESEDGYQEPMQVSADESEYEYQPEEEELGDPEEYENQYQELRESSIIESLYGYQPEEELGDPEEYENQYQELKETSIIEPEYESSYQEYQPDTENSEDFEEYENEYQEYQPEVEKVKEEYEYQPEEKLETEEYKYQPEPKEEYEYQPEPEEYEYQPESEPKEEEQYQPESEPKEYEYQPESEPKEYEYQPQSEELEAPEESVVEQPAEYELPDDSNENGGDEDEDENEVLTHDEIKGIIKDFIGKYSGVQGLDKQMLKTLQNIIVDDSCNIIIMGDAKSGKTSLGLDIIKVVNKIKRNNNRRIAKISADKLIGKELSIYFTRLRGSDIYIENISLMDDDTVTELLEAMNKDIDNRIVVIEDEKANAERFLNKHEEVRDYFANQIVVKQNKIKDWVEVAREYAEEQGYKIDEMGLLALHAKIDQLYAITLVIQKNHVDAVIDSAIKKAGKGGLIKKIFGKKKEKILTEEHFSL
ncbi:MAG: hypothetical protein K2N61_06900 [Lachnospiraceae bacterium]|nr:hypothetical protein [Lachnospiraceae bacterium]